MNDILQRIKSVIKHTGLSDTSFAKKIEMSQGTLSNMFQRDTIPKADMIVLISNVFKINSGWLLTGEGEMFQETKPPSSTLPDRSTRKVPLLRQKASAGPGVEWNSEDNIEGYLDPLDLLPSLAHIKPGAFRVAGSSMSGAGIYDGDIIFFNPETAGYYPDDFYVFSLDGNVYIKRITFEPLTRQVDIYSITEFDGMKLIKTLNLREDADTGRFTIIGRVVAWIHDNTVQRKRYSCVRPKTPSESNEDPLEKC